MSMFGSGHVVPDAAFRGDPERGGGGVARVRGRRAAPAVRARAPRRAAPDRRGAPGSRHPGVQEGRRPPLSRSAPAELARREMMRLVAAIVFLVLACGTTRADDAA